MENNMENNDSKVIEVSSFKDALNSVISGQADSAVLKTERKVDSAKAEQSTGSEANNTNAEQSEAGKITDDLRAKIVNEELQKSINELKKEGVDISNIKSFADLAKTAKEAQKKITKLAQEKAEKEKLETELEKKKREQIEQITDEEVKNALENFDFEKLSSLLMQQQKQIKELSEFSQSLKSEKEAIAKAEALKQSEEKRLDVVEDEFQSFSLKNKLSDDVQNAIRKYLQGKQEDGTFKPPKIFAKLLLVDKLDDENESDYRETLSEAFNIALKIVNAEKIGDPEKFAKSIEAEKQIKFDSLFSAVKKGEAIAKPRNSSNLSVKNTQNTPWHLRD